MTYKPQPVFDRTYGYNANLEAISTMWPQDKSGVIYKEEGKKKHDVNENDVKLLAELKVTQGKLETL